MDKMKGKQSLKKRMWKPEEDMLLKTYVEIHGEGNWSSVSKKLGLQRGGKSCRLRWKNYLRPDIKHGGMSKDEEDLILRMHKLIGNRWSLIAGRLPGRTDNEVKNYWNTHMSKKANRLSKRKASEMDKNHEEDSQKRAKMIGFEQSTWQEPHGGSPKEPGHEASTVDLVGDEINFRSDCGISKEDEKWSCLTGEVLAGTGGENIGCGGMGMDFGFGLGQEEMAAWDHAGYVLFDAFGINWDETLPPP